MRNSLTPIQACFRAALILLLFTCAGVTHAVETGIRSSFDHVQTGFPLLGAHAQADCQTCHLQGIFKGTPRQCEVCHTQGSRIASTFKTIGHPQTVMPCSQCHSSQVTWAGARFDHIGVTPGSCATCHNGVTATGKPVNHVVTNAPCDQCHRTAAWLPAGFDHFGVVPGTCTTCHEAGNATRKPQGHVATLSQCDVCHTTSAWKPAAVDHADAAVVVDGQCATCHGLSSMGKKDGHIPTTLSCDECHYRAPQPFSASYLWQNHTPAQGIVNGQCITCHNGSYVSSRAMGIPKVHIPTAGLACDNCHLKTKSDFKRTTLFTHAANQNVAPGGCSNCHNGSYSVANAQGKGATTHIPTSLSCDLCHSQTLADFKASTFAHLSSQGVAGGNCGTCHSGSYTLNGQVRGKPSPPNHVETTRTCDNCHITAAWTPAAFDHFGVKPGTCTTCHGVNATGKPQGHVTTSKQCDACHSTTAWKPAGVDHTTVVAGQCATCHGLTATAKKNGHIPTSLSCDACHERAPAHFKPSNLLKVHTPAQGIVDGQCNTCHNGSYTSSGAQGLASPHIPTAGLSCDICHKRPPTVLSFNKPTDFTHAANQNVVPGGCINCHSGSYYVAANAEGMAKTANKSAYNHFTPLLGTCDTCHTSYSSFKTYTFSHAGQGLAIPSTFVCSVCHDGSHSFVSAGKTALRGYQSEHKLSETKGGQCANGCHDSFTDWASTANRIVPQRSSHQNRIPQRTSGPIRR